MSMSTMQGFVSDDIDQKHQEVFSESWKASRFIKERLPKEGDRLFFHSEDDEWLQIVNKDGRMWIEIGEGAA